VLVEALRAADPAAVTDEARAVEALGLKPRLVMGDTRNLKVTYPEDLALAELILQSRQRPGKAASRKPPAASSKRIKQRRR
jgi:2-C-methyl-D-erythritol 4-phosphate cytidylyltransferase